MAFFLLILLLIINTGLVFSNGDSFNKDYLSKEHTTAVNGVFVILIVFSHYSQYADLGGVYDAPYLALKEHLGQMVVASFLFYSGFGMMESIKRKGAGYIRKIRSKFWQLLLRFDMAVFLFLGLGLAFGEKYTAAQIIVALASWTSIGNSNWYITAILLIYIVMYLSFGIGYKFSESSRDSIGVVLTLIMTAGLVFLQMKLGRPAYCYNTMILAPAGMIYSQLRGPFEKIIQKKDTRYFLITAVMLGVYIQSYFHRQDYGIKGYTIWALSYISILLLFTMKVSVYNGLLEWFGTHIFSIYILQRIPMMILDHFGIIESHKYISLVVVFLTTIPLALMFEKITGFVIKGITDGKSSKTEN